MIRLVTMIELERLTNNQLEELRIALHHLLALGEPGTTDRRNILASRENIDRVCNYHRAKRAPSL
ncbi:hypothetical protein [Pseudaestuariivita rosea]|uniref:hypothetical protein n=1 Tax=Pseudaestuariivita rosea TaxID=2763263 RepID=UPI001ABAC1B1|nr:hypothetical protein [Pseudaestuariivita rosea]